jgi:hypothetical protein
MTGSLPTDLDALALDLIEGCGNPERVLAVAARITKLAARERQGDEPPPVVVPPGVAAVWAGG